MIKFLLLVQKYNIPAFLLIFLFFLIYSFHSLSRHLQFASSALDLGIYVQGLYLYYHTLLPFSTLLHIPLLADHFGPILILFSPLYHLFPSASTLLIIQALLVSFSVLPIFLVAKDHLKNTFLGLLISLTYLASPSLLSAINFDFHLATIAVFPLSLLLYSWHFKKWSLYVSSLFLTLIVKEDLPIFIFGLGLFQLILGQKRLGILTSVFALIGFYLIKFQIMPFLWPGVEKYDLSTSILPLDSPIDLLALLLINPKIYLDQVFNSPIKLNTLDVVLRQFGFLPLLSPLTWLTVFPSLFLRFSSTLPHFWTSNFHYNANLMPFLAFSAILVIKKFNILAKAVVILLIFTLVTGGLAPYSFVWNFSQTSALTSSRFSYLQSALNRIPAEAAVSAQSPLVPHLANREKIYLFPDIYDAKYIVLDTALDTYPLKQKELKERIEALKKLSNWQVEQTNKSLIIFKKS